MNIDEVFKKIGELGKYQWLLVALWGYFGVTAAGFATMVVAFITAEPDWVCVKGYNNSICNYTEPISLTSKHYKARCDMPREAWTYVEGFTSTVTEYDLVCQKSYLQSVAQSCYWLGMFIGLSVGGYFSDKFGRRIILSIGICLIAFATWVMVFPKEFMVFIIARIVVGFGAGLRNACSFVLLTEYTTAKSRPKIGVTTFYFWVAGLLLLSLIGYFIPDWRMFLLTTAVISTPLFFMWWFIPESPRWLLIHGKENEAKKQLQKVARINGKEYPDDELEKPKNIYFQGGFKHLFYNVKARKTTLLSWNLWFTTSLVYYGVSYGSVDLGGNRYFNFALTSVIELPSNFAAIVALNRIGRKKTVISGLVIALIASAISISIPSDRSNSGYNGGRIFVATVAKFFINYAFSAVYVWSTELFPTYLRIVCVVAEHYLKRGNNYRALLPTLALHDGTGVATSSAAARIGSFLASYIIWLIRIHPILPYGIMGAICLQAAILSSFLPETKNRPTLETMDDLIKNEAITIPDNEPNKEITDSLL